MEGSIFHQGSRVRVEVPRTCHFLFLPGFPGHGVDVVYRPQSLPGLFLKRRELVRFLEFSQSRWFKPKLSRSLAGQAWLLVSPVPASHSSSNKKITAVVFLCFQGAVIVSLGADLQGNLFRRRLHSLFCLSLSAPVRWPIDANQIPV